MTEKLIDAIEKTDAAQKAIFELWEATDKTATVRSDDMLADRLKEYRSDILKMLETLEDLLSEHEKRALRKLKGDDA